LPVCKLLLGIQMWFGVQISAQMANRLSLLQWMVVSFADNCPLNPKVWDCYPLRQRQSVYHLG
jgi:hypothetical protein